MRRKRRLVPLASAVFCFCLFFSVVFFFEAGKLNGGDHVDSTDSQLSRAAISLSVLGVLFT